MCDMDIAGFDGGGAGLQSVVEPSGDTGYVGFVKRFRLMMVICITDIQWSERKRDIDRCKCFHCYLTVPSS